MAPEAFKSECSNADFVVIGRSKGAEFCHVVGDVVCPQGGCWANGMRVVGSAKTREGAMAGAQDDGASVVSAYCKIKKEKRLTAPVRNRQKPQRTINSIISQ